MRPACCVCVVALLWPAARVSAQPCPSLQCGFVSVAEAPGFEFPDAADFVPDRRPAVVVNLFGGSCFNPPIGGPAWWQLTTDDDGNGIVDSVDELVLRLDGLYADGWRRIILHLPAGSLAGQLMSSSQWWTMPPSKRAGLTERLGAWIAAHHSATLGVNGGFRINDPCSLCMSDCDTCSTCDESGDGCDTCPACWGAEAARLPDTTSAIDMCVVADNIGPWVDLGVYEIWFDGSAGANPDLWTALLQLAGNPDYMGTVKIVGEPVPNGGPAGGVNIPIPQAMNRLAYVSRRSYYETFGGGAPAKQWSFDPATTEVHVALRSDDFCVDMDTRDADPCTGCPEFCAGQPDGVLIDVVYDRVMRGYIPYARWDRAAEMVRRIYDMSPDTVPCPGDLDADGDVDFHDVARLSCEIGRLSGATLYHGDLDFDDDVDVFDMLILLNDPDLPGPCSAPSR